MNSISKVFEKLRIKIPEDGMHLFDCVVLNKMIDNSESEIQEIVKEKDKEIERLKELIDSMGNDYRILKKQNQELKEKIRKRIEELKELADKKYAFYNKFKTETWKNSQRVKSALRKCWELDLKRKELNSLLSEKEDSVMKEKLTPSISVHQSSSENNNERK
jgi:ribosomal protein L16 Arg81 hydroxylase